MKKYDVEQIKQNIDNNEFENVNLIVNEIMNSNNHTFNDLEVLKTILENQKVALESKEKIKYLYLKCKKEIEERIFNGESIGNSPKKLEHDFDENKINIKVTEEKKDDFAYVGIKSIILIIFLTILVIAVVTVITLRG